MVPFDEDGSVAEGLDSLRMCSLKLLPHVLHPRHHSHPTTAAAERGLRTPRENVDAAFKGTVSRDRFEKC